MVEVKAVPGDTNDGDDSNDDDSDNNDGIIKDNTSLAAASELQSSSRH
jgi:hypothetical protein